MKSRKSGRGKCYEHKNYDGGLRLIGVSNFLSKGDFAIEVELIRLAEGIAVPECGGISGAAEHARKAWLLAEDLAGCGNVFAVRMEAIKSYSLGQFSYALYDVDGEYRRKHVKPFERSLKRRLRRAFAFLGIFHSGELDGGPSPRGGDGN